MGERRKEREIKGRKCRVGIVGTRGWGGIKSGKPRNISAPPCSIPAELEPAPLGGRRSSESRANEGSPQST